MTMLARRQRIVGRWFVGYASYKTAISFQSIGDRAVGFIKHELYDCDVYAFYFWVGCVFLQHY